jgi:hypothetical protein
MRRSGAGKEKTNMPFQLPAVATIPGSAPDTANGFSGLGGFFRDLIGQTARDAAIFGQQRLYDKIGLEKRTDGTITKEEPAPQPVAEVGARPAIDTQTMLVVGGGVLAALVLVLALT